MAGLPESFKTSMADNDTPAATDYARRKHAVKTLNDKAVLCAL